MANQVNAPGFIHNVFFWLKKETTEEERSSFLKNLKRLSKIDTVRSLFAGTPAGTPRNVVDNSYDFALIVHLDDAKGHDAYQVDPIHDEFVAAQSAIWAKVQVYDVLTK